MNQEMSTEELLAFQRELRYQLSQVTEMLRIRVAGVQVVVELKNLTR